MILKLAPFNLQKPFLSSVPSISMQPRLIRCDLSVIYLIFIDHENRVLQNHVFGFTSIQYYSKRFHFRNVNDLFYLVLCQIVHNKDLLQVACKVIPVEGQTGAKILTRIFGFSKMLGFFSGFFGIFGFFFGFLGFFFEGFNDFWIFWSF